jgi:iron complex outermembrane receptor protein
LLKVSVSNRYSKDPLGEKNMPKIIASRSIVAALTFAVTTFNSAHVIAQSTAPNSTGLTQPPSAAADASKTPPIEEIFVTARKTSERLQDAPMSIAVVSSDRIEKTGVITLEDLGRAVAGLTIVSAAPGQNTITLRGLSGNYTVGLYLDDTPLSIGVGLAFGSNLVLDPALVDLDRIEVLRGPQGTLYGASSFGGTVRYITNQPDLTETHATAKTTLSDTDRGGFNQEVDSLLNLPLIPGYVAVRAMAFERDYSGYIDRYPTDPNNYLAVLSGPADMNVNTEKTYGGRISIEAKPTDAFSATLSAFYQRMDLGGAYTFDDPPGSFDHPIQSRLVPEPSTDRLSLYTLTLQGDVQAVHVTSSTSYLDRYGFNAEDDSKPLNFFVPLDAVYPSAIFAENGNHDFVEEVRASGSAGPVHALAGLFYAHAVSYGSLNWPAPPQYVAVFGEGVPAVYGWNDFLDTQKAAFAEVNIDLAPGFQATLGDRIYRQNQRYGVYVTGFFNGGTSPTKFSTSEASGTTPKYGLSYHVSSDILTYATVSKGYREGGPLFQVPSLCDADLANIGLSSPPTAFKPDSIWNYELGAKTQWLDRRLTINSALYYIDWTNIQQAISLPTCGFAFTGNFGTASSKGAEFEMDYEPTAALRLGLSFAYNEAKLTSTIPGAQGQAGETLEYAPKWSGTISAEYTRQIAADTSAYLRGDFNITSHEFANFDTQSAYRDVAGYSLLNLRLGVKHKAWQGALFVRNALDRRAETELPVANGIDLPTQRRISLNRPRTIGIDIRFDY